MRAADYNLSRPMSQCRNETTLKHAEEVVDDAEQMTVLSVHVDFTQFLRRCL